jgi:hypothetical protein
MGAGQILPEMYVNSHKYIYGQSKASWPTSESQVTSIKIGGKTISARYSGRRRYDVRLDDANEEIRSRSDRNFRFSIEEILS